ncbi:MAG: NAD-dependent epimerase/dehydratase family protein [Acidimicrobiales bacterium]
MVTGGCGFIGAALVARLQALGAEVRVADLTLGPTEALGRVRPQLVQGDLCDPEVAERAVTRDVTVVFHLAAMTSVLESVANPAEVYRTNVAMTASILERCRVLGVGSFVLASTNAVIGGGLAELGSQATPPAINELAPLRPLTPYGATKAAGEMLACAYGASYGMTNCAVRFTNVYGPGMANKDSFVPRLMRAALNDSLVHVYGQGAQVRDYLYVSDAVEAMVLAWKSSVTGPLTVGSGVSTSVLELVDAAREATGRPIRTDHIEPPVGEMPAVVVDTSVARSLGFEPRVCLADGLVETWRAFARHVEPAL